LRPTIKGTPFTDQRPRADSENSIDDRNIKRRMQEFLISRMEHIADSNNIVSLKNTISLLSFLRNIQMEPDLWECQNIFYELYGKQEFNNSLSPEASALFRELGRSLGFLIEEQHHD
jgi:hypothetical protein